MTTSLILIFALSFGFIAYKNFRLAFFIFILILPSYLLRLNLGPLPSTALEVSFGVLLLVWAIKYYRGDRVNIKIFFVKQRWFAIFFGAFFVASLAGVFVSDMWWYSFGQWRAYFLQPIILFIILIGRKDYFSVQNYTDALAWSSLSVSSLAIAQKMFSFGLDNYGRSLSFFTSPNAVGLYLAPIMVLLAGVLYKKIINIKIWPFLLYFKEFWLLLLSCLAVLFTRSFGTIVGLFAALMVALFTLRKRHAFVSITTAFVVGVVGVLLFSPLSIQKSQSLTNRFTLWSYTVEFLTKSPKNFILGAGVRQYFRKVQKPHYEPKELERLIYPHNIFLNFWTETGLVGMFGFMGVVVRLAFFSNNIMRKKDLIMAAISFGVLTVVVVHGLIDVPYFKNDLAMMFWFLAAFIIRNKETT